MLPSIRVPTLVLHRTGDRAISVANARYLAEHIPGARFVELPGDDHLPFTGDQDAVLDEVERFLTGSEATRTPHPVLATVLLTEIVHAMAIAARIGDTAWRQLLDDHMAIIGEEIARFRGQQIHKQGASSTAVFDGPARAIRCAAAIVARSRALNLEVRAGLHVGECDLDRDVGGPAYQLAVRVLARAEPGEVIVSSTITDLVAGSGIAFEPMGKQLPIGGSRRLELFRVASISSRATVTESIASTAAPDGVPLTPRELKVTTLIGRGLSNRQIAEHLSISIATVERHAANIFNKLGLHSRSQVAVWAAEHGLLVADAS